MIQRWILGYLDDLFGHLKGSRIIPIDEEPLVTLIGGRTTECSSVMTNEIRLEFDGFNQQADFDTTCCTFDWAKDLWLLLIGGRTTEFLSLMTNEILLDFDQFDEKADYDTACCTFDWAKDALKPANKGIKASAKNV